MRKLLSMFSALAGIGLALSILSHLAALFGKPGPLGRYTFSLGIGIVVVWLPAVLAAWGAQGGIIGERPSGGVRPG